ncbi:MAG: hypothetical protein ABIM89_19595 [Mycobacteriales bacterium]
MAEDLHRNTSGHTLREEQCRGRVPGVVEPRAADTGSVEKQLPGPMVRSRIDRLSDLADEHQARVRPQLPGGQSLNSLYVQLATQSADKRLREHNRSPSCVALRLDEDETATWSSL